MRITQSNEDGSITFCLSQRYARDSQTVEIAGSFSQWGRIPMVRDGEYWIHRTTPLSPGKYLYKFIVNEEWMSDPAVLDSEPCSGNSIMHTGSSQGNCYHLSFYSTALGEEKRYVIYLPPSYFFQSHRYFPTLYLLGGLFDYELSWYKDGLAHHAADTLIRENQIDQMIIVMPDKDNSCFADGDWQRFTVYMTRDVIHHIDSNYRTISVEGNRAIEGLSLGGGWAIRLGVQFPHLFQSIGILSASIPQDVISHINENVGQLTSHKLRFRLFCGSEEQTLISHLKWAQRWLTEKGFMSEIHVDEGEHRWYLWRQAIENSLKFHNYTFRNAITGK